MHIFDEGLEAIGEEYHELRRRLMLGRQHGLTQIYNSLHNPDEQDSEIKKLRDLHRELDTKTAHAYGWKDLDLNHDFHEVAHLPENDRIRFTISEAARLEVLRRLAALNLQRYAEEVDQSLHGGTAGSGKGRGRRSRGTSTSEPTLDLDDILPTTIEGGD